MRFLAAAILVLASGAARAELAPGHVVNAKASKTEREAATAASEAGQALVQNDFNGAVSAADRAIAVDAKQPWAHYVRAEALVRLGRLDDGLAELRLAEHDFPADEHWSKSVAVWGRANAFYQVGRCAEAKTAFAEYIALVKADDKDAADLAQTRIDGCKVPWVAPAAPVK